MEIEWGWAVYPWEIVYWWVCLLGVFDNEVRYKFTANFLIILKVENLKRGPKLLYYKFKKKFINFSSLWSYFLTEKKAQIDLSRNH